MYRILTEFGQGTQQHLHCYFDKRVEGQWGKLNGQKSFETSKCLKMKQSYRLESLKIVALISYEVFKGFAVIILDRGHLHLKLIYQGRLWRGFPGPSCPRRRFRHRRRLCTIFVSQVFYFYFCCGLVESPAEKEIKRYNLQLDCCATSSTEIDLRI